MSPVPALPVFVRAEIPLVSVNFVNFRFRSGQSGNQPAQDRDARFEVVDAVPVEADEGDRRDHQQQDCRDDETAASIRFVDRRVRAFGTVHGESL